MVTEVDNADLDRSDRNDRWRLATALLGVLLVAAIAWALLTDAKSAANNAATSRAQTYSLAQQVAAACAAQDTPADLGTLCANAAALAKGGPSAAAGPPGDLGPQGPPGPAGADSFIPGPPGPAGKDSVIPGIAGTQGLAGATGANGANGVDGAAGPAGKDGATGVQGPAGATGPAGAAGATGEPPLSWTVTDANGRESTCVRSTPFDPTAPTYICAPTR